MAGDDIDFTEGTTIIPAYNSVSHSLQVADSELFTFLTLLRVSCIATSSLLALLHRDSFFRSTPLPYVQAIRFFDWQF